MATKPTLALIPSGYGTNKVYSVLPSDGSGDFTFGRTGTATRINKDKLIESVGSNIPRIDYTDLGCPSLLLEPQRSNLVTYSEDLTNWVQSGVSIISNSAISPDGTLNADKITATSVDPSPYILANVTATEHTFSFYYKGEGNSIGKQARVLFWFIGTATGTTTSVNFTLTGDWQRFESQITPTGAGTLALRIDFPSDVAVVGDYGYLWGAQLEQGSYPTSYIPTTGTSVTRIGETATGSGNADTFNDSEGVLMVETSAFEYPITSNNWLTITDGSASNSLGILFETTGTVTARHEVGGVNYSYLNYNIDYTNVLKIAYKYKLNDLQLWVNGFKVKSSLNAPIFPNNTLNTLQLQYGGGSNAFYGKTKDLRVYNTALTDLELETLTSFTSFNAMALALNYTIY